jgi:DNA-binding GntR family transcriptional regulator
MNASAVQRMSVREQVLQIIRAQVTSGELEPNEIYSAVMLGERLGVSATPVREAMLELANAGLVEAVRNRGFRVLEMSDKDLDEVVELRLMLEIPPLKKVIEHASDQELAALVPKAQAIVDAAAAVHELAPYVIADDEFHLGLLGLAGNERLVSIVSLLRHQTQLIGLRRLSEAGDLPHNAEEHLRIVEALQARDVELAEERMARHLNHARGIWAGRPDDQNVGVT